MQSVIQYIDSELKDLYPKTEIEGFKRIIIHNIFGFDFTQIQLNRDVKLGKSKVEDIVLRLKKYEPIQYIFGETEFYGLPLKVNSDVLIPRPETEELVEWVLKKGNLKNPVILDIGTGSGCIALALKKKIPDAVVSAIDVSKKALDIALQNAKRNHLDVNFFHADILNWEDYTWGDFDLIMSNPPYVTEMEKNVMAPNVLHYEPVGALFVPDSDPLIFYRKIGGFAQKYLRKGGFLFVEINEKFGKETIQLFIDLGFKNCILQKDLQGKNRMLSCIK